MKRTIKVYDTYSFTTKDPIIDEMRTAWQDSGDTLSYLSRLSGVSANTMSNWFGGKVRSPQTSSACAFMGAMGYQRSWVKSRKQQEHVAKLAAKLNGKGKK